MSSRRINPRGIGKSITVIFILHVFAAFGFPQDPQSFPLKIMTYNIWNGFEWGKDSVRREKCITWIKSHEPDVLALQELCAYTEEKLREDAKKWGHPYVQLLKTEGYPTALTSKRPIRLIEKIVEPFWHGLLHCETYGINFYVVHLSPADCNIRLTEARLITDRIKHNENDTFIILGDFNSFSPSDGIWLEVNADLKNRSRPKNENNYSNLRMGEFDYSVMSEFLACPAVDLCLGKVDLQGAFTFPTPALIGKYKHTAETIIQYRVRIDYILASPSLALACRKVDVFNQEDTYLLSDHFPVMAEFLIIQE
jgi:endonuclease/exonuclease/phosphatase family metal-dependent hydrolase